MVSTIPSAVSGLTKHDAPSDAETPSGRTRQAAAGTDRYSPYRPLPASATVLPRSPLAWSPVATTVPAPSVPTAMGTPRRLAIARRPASGTAMVVRRDAPSPVVLALEMRRPKAVRDRTD